MVGREAFWFLSNYPRSASSFPVLSSSLGNRDYNGATVPLYGYAAPAYGYAATAPLYNYAAPVADLAPPAYGYAAPTYAGDGGNDHCYRDAWFGLPSGTCSVRVL